MECGQGLDVTDVASSDVSGGVPVTADSAGSGGSFTGAASPPTVLAAAQADAAAGGASQCGPSTATGAGAGAGAGGGAAGTPCSDERGPGTDPAPYTLGHGHESLEVRTSAIPDAGRGLFTTAPVPSGSVVAVYTGDVLRTVQAMRVKDKVGRARGPHHEGSLHRVHRVATVRRATSCGSGPKPMWTRARGRTCLLASSTTAGTRPSTMSASTSSPT